MEEVSKKVLRIGMALVFLYFGFSQVTGPDIWAGYVPEFLTGGLSPNNWVMINGVLELTLGVFLLAGLYVRFASGILALHMFGIVLSIGLTPIGVRDFGVAVATLVVWFNGVDGWCLDRKFGDEKVANLVV